MSIATSMSTGEASHLMKYFRSHCIPRKLLPGLLFAKLTGPFWFENDDGETQTVNSVRYVEVLEKFWVALRRKVGALNMPLQWFQQDGATPHTANISMNWVKTKFENRLIASKSEIEWSPHSPDLSPLDYWFWGYAIDNVYANRPATLEALNASVSAFTRRITIQQVSNAVDNIHRIILTCLGQRGGHLEHILRHGRLR